MKALDTAIFGKLAGSLLDADIGGRFFKGKADAGTDYPYVIYFGVSDAPDNVFAKKGESRLLQFSLFSKTPSSSEIEDMRDHLRALYDDCSLTVTGHNITQFSWQNTIPPQKEDVDALPDGTTEIWVCHIDYQIDTQES